MTSINSSFLLYLTAALNGGADIDELVEKYWKTDSNDASIIKPIIQNVLKPYFDSYSTAFKSKAKDALGYYLATDKINFEQLYNALLLPIDTPNNPKQFYIWIWEIFFEGSDYRTYNEYNYIEKYDIDEPLTIFKFNW